MMNRQTVDTPNDTAAIHTSDCIHWTTPSPHPELVLSFDDEALAAYAQQVRPVYERLKRVLGQAAGLLILHQTAPARADRDQPMVTTAREQVEEAREALGTIQIPHNGRRHHATLGEILDHLEAVFAALRCNIDLLTPDSHDLDTALRRLFSAHGLLLAVSDDRAGMTPVDFSHACCSCGAGTSGPSRNGVQTSHTTSENH